MTLPRLFSLSLLLGAVVLLATACLSPVRKTGYLTGGYKDFDALDEDGMRLRLAPEFVTERAALETVSQDSATSQPAVFIVPEPRWLVAHILPDAPERREEVLFTIRERFYRYLLRAYPHPVRVRYAWRPSDMLLEGYRVYTIETAVTDVHPGTPWLRYLVGWGAGAVEIQIEGRIWEGVGERRLVGEFVLREWHSGYAQNGLNTQVLRVDYCLRYAAEEVILAFTGQLPAHIEGVRFLPADGAGVEIVSRQEGAGSGDLEGEPPAAQ